MLGDHPQIGEAADDSAFLLSGSHGAETWVPGEGELDAATDPDDVALRDELRTELLARTADLQGVWIEPKTFGFAVHTRMSSPEDAAAANERADALLAERAPQWRRRTGQNIVEYAFRHEGKDSAVRELRERTGATAVLFAGDDVTDEDALRSLGEGDLGVHVGTKETVASVRVADIAAFAALLSRLADLRAAQPQ